MQWIRGALSLEVKRPGREADHSLPSSAEVKKNAWNYTSTPPISLHIVVLGLKKHREKFTFYDMYSSPNALYVHKTEKGESLEI
jgi:hypothetical protein